MRIILITFCLPFLLGFSGVTYRNYTHDTATQVHVLTLDPTKVKISAVRAQDFGHGVDNVANLAEYSSAVAAINGGFFRVNHPISLTGIPTGVLKINHKWHGIAYKPRGAIGWDPHTNEVIFDIVQTDSSIKIADRSLPIHAMNNILEGNRATLISDSYTDGVTGKVSILFNNHQVKDIYVADSIRIPQGNYVYNANGILGERLQNIEVGDPVELQILTIPILAADNTDMWQRMPNIMGGGPLLIKNGEIIEDYTLEKFSNEAINTRRARTAVGILPNGNWVFVVAEESFISENAGMTFKELAQFMHSLNCIAALNLDGGRSSFMYVDSSIATSARTFGPVRPVSDALVVTLKQP